MINSGTSLLFHFQNTSQYPALVEPILLILPSPESLSNARWIVRTVLPVLPASISLVCVGSSFSSKYTFVSVGTMLVKHGRNVIHCFIDFARSFLELQCF